MRTLGLTRRDFTSCGNPTHVVWWMGEETRHWTALLCGGVDDLPLPEQPREYGPYLACTAEDAYIEVRLCWHQGLQCVQVESYAETHRALKRWTGTRYGHFKAMSEAVTYARSEVKLLHKWLNSDGTAQHLLVPGPQFGVRVSARPAVQVSAEIRRLEAQQARMQPLVGTGSKATIAARNAARDRVGARLHELRRELGEA